MEDIQLCHEIFIIDADLKEPLDVEKKEEWTRTLVTDLMNTLDMKPLAPLGVYDAADLRAPGWSFIQPITTSHISGHYFAAPGPHPHIHVDIYSCHHFDPKTTLTTLSKHMKFLGWQATFVERSWNGTQRNIQMMSSND